MKVLVRQPRPPPCRKKDKASSKKWQKLYETFCCLSFFTSLGVESLGRPAKWYWGQLFSARHSMPDHIYPSIYPYLCLVFVRKINNLLARRFFVFLFFPTASSLLIFLSYTRFFFYFRWHRSLVLFCLFCFLFHLAFLSVSNIELEYLHICLY